MPLYEFRCPKCDHEYTVLLRISENTQSQPCPECGVPGNRIYSSPMIAPTFTPYQCPVTGKSITTKKAHTENLKRHGCRVLETGEREDYQRKRAAEDSALEKAIERTTEEFVEKLPVKKREQLARELQSGTEVSVTRN